MRQNYFGLPPVKNCLDRSHCFTDRHRFYPDYQDAVSFGTDDFRTQKSIPDEKKLPVCGLKNRPLWLFRRETRSLSIHSQAWKALRRLADLFHGGTSHNL